MKLALLPALAWLIPALWAATPNDVLHRLNAVHPPRPPGLIVHRGDRIALCGDSITEQRQYSRIIETYLTACVPELEVSVRQYGWSGERADGFFARMGNDVLRFRPTIATTCYGMNDHLYRPFEPWIGELYRLHQDAIVRRFQMDGVRVVIGSPGCVGKMPSWVKTASGTVDDLNLSLATFRNIDAGIARERGAVFADLFPALYHAHLDATAKYGPGYAIPGPDGVHPDWAGQTVMAFAFLKALGLHGNIGVISHDVSSGRSHVSEGHGILSAAPGVIQIVSRRYPFVAAPADLSKHDSIRSGFQWVPFERDLNRFQLVVKGTSAAYYRVTWGHFSKTFHATALHAGINLAAEFPVNPFEAAFRRVDEAVAAKQEFETRQIKQEFHGAAGAANMEATVLRTEAQRAPLAAAVRNAVVPVTHTVVIEPL